MTTKLKLVAIEAVAMACARWRNGKKLAFPDFAALPKAEQEAYRDQAKAAIDAYEAARSPHEAQGCDVATVKQWCPSCGGNDANYPCAYPGDNKRGCMRNERLQSDGVTVAKLLAAMKQARRLGKFLDSIEHERGGVLNFDGQFYYKVPESVFRFNKESLAAIDAVLGEVAGGQPQSHDSEPSGSAAPTPDRQGDGCIATPSPANNQSDGCRKAYVEWFRNEYGVEPHCAARWKVWQAAIAHRDGELVAMRGTLEPIKDCGWHGKWRIEKVLKVLDKILGK